MKTQFVIFIRTLRINKARTLCINKARDYMFNSFQQFMTFNDIFHQTS